GGAQVETGSERAVPVGSVEEIPPEIVVRAALALEALVIRANGMVYVANDCTGEVGKLELDGGMSGASDLDPLGVRGLGREGCESVSNVLPHPLLPVSQDLG